MATLRVTHVYPAFDGKEMSLTTDHEDLTQGECEAKIQDIKEMFLLDPAEGYPGWWDAIPAPSEAVDIKPELLRWQARRRQVGEDDALPKLNIPEQIELAQYQAHANRVLVPGRYHFEIIP